MSVCVAWTGVMNRIRFVGRSAKGHETLRGGCREGRGFLVEVCEGGILFLSNGWGRKVL